MFSPQKYTFGSTKSEFLALLKKVKISNFGGHLARGGEVFRWSGCVCRGDPKVKNAKCVLDDFLTSLVYLARGYRGDT